MTGEQSREVHLVQGGTPAALALARVLAEPTPEQRARLEATFAELARWSQETVAAIAEALGRAVEALRPLLDLQVGPIRQQLVDAGVIPDPGPEDPRARALWLHEHRGTGPDRQLQHAHRPRRVR